jgi:hypothetical protein
MFPACKFPAITGFSFSWSLHVHVVHLLVILMFRTCTIAHSLRSLGPHSNFSSHARSKHTRSSLSCATHSEQTCSLHARSLRYIVRFEHRLRLRDSFPIRWRCEALELRNEKRSTLFAVVLIGSKPLLPPTPSYPSRLPYFSLSLFFSV